MTSKRFFLKISYITFILELVFGNEISLNNDEHEAMIEMEKVNSAMMKLENRRSLALWDKSTNVSPETIKKYENTKSECDREEKQLLKKLQKFNWQSFNDENLKMKFKYYNKQEVQLPEEEEKRLDTLNNNLEKNYAIFRVCNYTNRTDCDMKLETDVSPIVTKSRDSEELKHYWMEWHKLGAPIKNDYAEFVKLMNKAVRLNNFTSIAESWLSAYEQNGFEDEVLKLWKNLEPLYKQLHAYIRKKLFDQYGPGVVNRKGPIPAHLFGDVLGMEFSSIQSFARPFLSKPDVDITETLKKQNYTPIKIVKLAEDFYTSMNFTKMTDKFWNNSILEKPTDGREIQCVASAYDFYDDEDFRISMCTVLDQLNFEAAFHEMGHIETYMQYKGLPHMYRKAKKYDLNGAVGEAIILSVMSPKHLKLVGLMEEGLSDEETELNNLFSKASTRIALLPFALMIDVYRHSIFREQTKPEDYNCHYWKLRERFQGVEPPVNRTEADFDAAALYHFSVNVEFWNYYVSFIVMFQFHRSMCEKAGQYNGSDNTKLTDCDIYGSANAGNALKNMMSLGYSVPWQHSLKLLTGQSKIDTNGILDYFAPLKRWLEKENMKTDEYIGWERSTVEFCTARQEKKIENARISKLLQKQKEKTNINRTSIKSIYNFFTNVINYIFNFVSLIKSQYFNDYF